MGTDIHMYIERRNPDGSWRTVAPPEPPLGLQRFGFWGPGECFYVIKCCGSRNADGPCTGKDCGVCLGTGRDIRWYHARNYDVFAILTGTVRNYNCISGIVPEPRGVPADVSESVRIGYLWDHSAGWLTLDEVLSFDWLPFGWPKYPGVNSFLEFVREYLVPLGDPKDTRLVFGFDS